MTTIIPGITIDMVVDGDTSSGTLIGGTISRSSGHMVVWVAQSYTHSGVQLPAGMNVGDVVEVYIDLTMNTPMWVFPPSGENFGTAYPANEPGQVGIGGSSPSGARFRKISSSTWGAV